MNPFAEPGELQNLAHDYRNGLYLEAERMEQYFELVSLAQDLCHPEQYGHSIPAEVIRRASRVLKLAQPPRQA